MRTKYDNSLVKKQAIDIEDIDFVGQAEEQSAANLETVNLFGVPLDTLSEAAEGETTLEKNKKRAFIRELIDVMETLDPENELQDFERPKRFVNFDPNNEDLHATSIDA